MKITTSSSSRVRTSFDPELELPKLHQWFAENPHPSRLTLQMYVRELNNLGSRQSRKLLEVHNLCYWFNNARAAYKRADVRMKKNYEHQNKQTHRNTTRDQQQIQQHQQHDKSPTQQQQQTGVNHQSVTNKSSINTNLIEQQSQQKQLSTLEATNSLEETTDEKFTTTMLGSNKPALKLRSHNNVLPAINGSSQVQPKDHHQQQQHQQKQHQQKQLDTSRRVTERSLSQQDSTRSKKTYFPRTQIMLPNEAKIGSSVLMNRDTKITFNSAVKASQLRNINSVSSSFGHITAETSTSSSDNAPESPISRPDSISPNSSGTTSTTGGALLVQPANGLASLDLANAVNCLLSTASNFTTAATVAAAAAASTTLTSGVIQPAAGALISNSATSAAINLAATLLNSNLINPLVDATGTGLAAAALSGRHVTGLPVPDPSLSAVRLVDQPLRPLFNPAAYQLALGILDNKMLDTNVLNSMTFPTTRCPPQLAFARHGLHSTSPAQLTPTTTNLLAADPQAAVASFGFGLTPDATANQHLRQHLHTAPGAANHHRHQHLQHHARTRLNNSRQNGL